ENGNTYYYWLEQVDFDGESHFSWSIEATPEATIIPEPDHYNFSLKQNVPNPFNPTTVIEFTLDGDQGTSQYVQLKIYNVLGELVATPVDGKLSAGPHKITWTCPTNASGVFFYQLKTDKVVETKKMVILK
ncbi:MAG: hypothetical protein DRH57_02900, partial [Candidatus Cloacimonadota bacterium]